MAVQSKFKRIALSSIRVSRETRQRRDLELTADGLAESIQARGVLNPIIVAAALDDDSLCDLIAGERRYSISLSLGLKDIPVRWYSELSELEREYIELDENIRRQALCWQDLVQAVARLHSKLQLLKGEAWTMADTAEETGHSRTFLTKALRIVREWDNPAVQKASGYAEAYNMLSRKDERAEADAMSDIMEASTASVQSAMAKGSVSGASAVPGEAGQQLPAAPPRSETLPAEESILRANFLEWAPAYSGPRFNFIHMDFPYGINAFSGPQSGKLRHEATYADTADIYWALIESFCSNLDKLLAPSGHIVFWLSADIEIMSRTLRAFAQLAPRLAFGRKPLIWHKTDNVGVLADPQRGPRHVYEAALFAASEDRKIVKAVSDTYGAPKGSDTHPSVKPVPVLKHFFQMFIDSNTRMLDPTCGSAASLRAAEALDAAFVLGLELDEAHHNAACSNLRKDRLLRAASR